MKNLQSSTSTRHVGHRNRRNGLLMDKKMKDCARGMEAPEGDLYAKTMVRIYAAYEETVNGWFGRLRRAVTAGPRVCQNPRNAATLSEALKTILVDEFQDTNTIQYAWLRVLAGQRFGKRRRGGRRSVNLRLAAPGWRISTPEDFRQQKRCAEQTTARLQRFSKLPTASLRVMPVVWVKPRTEGERGDPISLYAGFNEQDEAWYIVEQAEWSSKAPVAHRILYRSNAQSRVLEKRCCARVLYRFTVASVFTSAWNARLAYLRWPDPRR